MGNGIGRLFASLPGPLPPGAGRPGAGRRGSPRTGSTPDRALSPGRG